MALFGPPSSGVFTVTRVLLKRLPDAGLQPRHAPEVRLGRRYTLEFFV